MIAEERTSAPAEVSAVIPAYNYAHYLPETIRSVLTQTFQRFELIVVDDGSTDNTEQVVRTFTDERVRYLRQPNQGLSAARNTGIQASRTGYVAFLDADDLWQPTFLERVMAEYSRLGEDYALLATATSRIDEAGRPLPPNRHSASYRHWRGEVKAGDFCLRNQPISSSVVIRREAFEQCGVFDTSLRSSEDRDMWIRIAARYRCWVLDEPLVRLRRHRASMSRNAPRMERSSRTVLHRAWQREAVSRRRLAFWMRAFAVHYLVSAWTHHHQHYRLRAMGYLGLSTLCWPIFFDPGEIREPALFRLRSLFHFMRGCLQRQS